jgi:DNA-binding helix-hairpin-helix protein with protein kinase domain
VLKSGQRVRTRSAVECVVGDLIGSGGQGAVYRAVADETEVALKWYFPQWRAYDVGLRTRLEAIVEAGNPSERFLWPLELVVNDAGEFGYIMPLRDRGYSSMTALLAGKIDATFGTLATASFQLAQTFHELHAEGLSYQDISDRNVWIDPKLGGVQICDVDNVSVNGVPAAIAGTPGFTAPEIILDESVSPSADTDRYSLAVLIFKMLMMADPLLGAAELNYPAFNADAMRKLYGEHPVFVLDPNDQSNRPVAGMHDRILELWPLYPRYIRELFTRAFTEGLRRPEARVREREWRKYLVRMRDMIVLCECCSAENFYDEETCDTQRCWSCAKELIEPLRIEIGDVQVVLNKDTKLYEHHLQPECRFEFKRILARVTVHPQQHDLWGLCNESGRGWTVTTGTGYTTTVPPQHAARLEVGMQFDFGDSHGRVVHRVAAAR